MLARDEAYRKKIISLEEQKIVDARRAEQQRNINAIINGMGKIGGSRINCISTTSAGVVFTDCN